MGMTQINPSLLTITPAGAVVAGSLVLLMSFAATGLRLYSSRRQQLRYGPDDWTMLVGACLVFVLGLTLVVGSAIGVLGRHQLSDVEVAEKVILAYSTVEKVAFASVETSVVLMYRRIFRGHFPSRPGVTNTMLGVIIAACVAFVVAAAAQCPTRNWEAVDMLQTLARDCAPQELVALASAVTNTVICALLLAMPLPTLFRLGAEPGVRMCIGPAAVLASCPVIVGCVRIGVLFHFTFSTQEGYRDTVGIMSTAVVLSLAELGLAVMASCLPACCNLLAARFGIGMPDGSMGLNGYPPSGSHTPPSVTFVPSSPMEHGTPVRGGYDRIEEEPEEEERQEKMQTEESKVADLPRVIRAKGSFGGAFPLQKISDAASGRLEKVNVRISEMEGDIPSLGSTEQLCVPAATRSKTPEMPIVGGTLRDYDPERQCWS